MSKLSARNRVLVFVGLLGVSGASCEACSGGGGGGGGNSTGGGWLVGQSGLMLNLTAEVPPQLGVYSLDERRSLLAIACRGTAEAWVAGEAGLLLATDDGGASWRAIASGVAGPLRAVALAATAQVFVAGDAGVLRLSRDRGHSWTSVPSPAVSWTSIAASDDGQTAWLTTAGGQLYRLGAEQPSLTQLASVSTGALHAVALAPGGRGVIAAAVGERGALLVSRDGGLTWSDRPSGTDRTLRDVWLVAEGRRLLAVGDGGVLVELSPLTTEPPVLRTLGEGLTLRGLHLEATGHGTVVGDRGTVLVTHDFARTWTLVPTSEARDILSVDAVKAGPHL